MLAGTHSSCAVIIRMLTPDFPVQVINMSFGLNGYTIAWLQAMNRAASAGIPVAAAAGNDNVNAQTVYPCAFSVTGTTSVNCVAAVGKSNTYERVESSNFGDPVVVAAPGWQITSLGASSDIATNTRTRKTLCR